MAEKEITIFSAEEIEFVLPPYNLSYWKSIHYQLFREAGKLRTVFITKNETQFCNPQYIEQEANRLFNQLAKDNFYSNFITNKTYK